MEIVYERQLEKHYDKITDVKFGNKILNQIKENYKLQGELYLHPKYKYLEETSENSNLPYHTLLYKTKYGLEIYCLKFESGCFLPYLFKKNYIIPHKVYIEGDWYKNTKCNDLDILIQCFPKCNYFKQLKHDFKK